MTTNNRYNTKNDEYKETLESTLHQFLQCARLQGNHIPAAKSDENPQLLVFGYGSLIWKPNFEYETRLVGHVRGFVRRFWQGNVTHRGVPGSPGRVATLVEDAEGETWGVAYHLKGKSQIQFALQHLFTREISKGGYAIKSAQFYTEHSPCDMNVVTFVATPSNQHYLGPATIDSVARTMVNSRGESGHNLEYLFNLVDALRNEAPHGVDNHLSSLEDACHQHLSGILLRRHVALGCGRRWDDCCECLSQNERGDDQYVLKCISSRLCFIKKCMKDKMSQ